MTDDLERLLDEALPTLSPSALSPEAQTEVERVMHGGKPDAYLDRIDHDRGYGG